MFAASQLGQIEMIWLLVDAGSNLALQDKVFDAY